MVSVVMRMKEAKAVAPATILRPMELTKADMDETALRGRSCVGRGSVEVGSAILIRGTKSVVPRMLRIMGRRHANRRMRFGVPSGYPIYSRPAMEVRNRTTMGYVGVSYPTRVEEKVVRFTSESTVGVSKLKRSVVDLLLGRGVVGSVSSLCGVGGRSVMDLREVNRGSTAGLVGTVGGSGRGSL